MKKLFLITTMLLNSLPIITMQPETTETCCCLGFIFWQKQNNEQKPLFLINGKPIDKKDITDKRETATTDVLSEMADIYLKKKKTKKELKNTQETDVDNTDQFNPSAGYVSSSTGDPASSIKACDDLYRHLKQNKQSVLKKHQSNK